MRIVESTIAQRESAALTRSRRVVSSRTMSYDVDIVQDLAGTGLEALIDAIAGRRCLLVTTPSVAALYANTLAETLRESSVDLDLLVLPLTERSKDQHSLFEICAEAQRLMLARDALLVSMGGGVCSDLVTLAASLYRRGIAHLRIPTTLLGQIDASIGVKGAINFAGKKNNLGCYTAPETVFVDPAYLRSLSTNQVREGLAEIIKIALVRDSNLFVWLEKNAEQLIESRMQMPLNVAEAVIDAAIGGMLEELEPNLLENQTYERLVDFGHTVGPVLEAASGFMLPHGQAVAIDMAFSAMLAAELGMLPASHALRVVQLLKRCGLPLSSPQLDERLVLEAFEDAQAHRAGTLNLVVPLAIGRGGFLRHAKQIGIDSIAAALSKLDEKTPPVPGATTFRKRSKPPLRAPAVALPVLSALHNKALVFDIGGTQLRAAVFDQGSQSLGATRSIATPNFRGHPLAGPEQLLEQTLARMDLLARDLLGFAQPQSVTVAFAGPLDAQSRIVAAPTIWGEQQPESPIDLSDRLAKLWPESAVAVLNDVTAAGYRFLRGPTDDFCVVTLGSGIGNKVFINGAPFTGVGGRGGEIGHLRVSDHVDAPLCDCGDRGHLGAIASGRGALATATWFMTRYSEEFSCSSLTSATLTNTTLVQAFHAGDPWAVRVIEYGARKLAAALAGVHQSLGIERFVLFGGFPSALGEPYLKLVADLAAASCWSSGQNWPLMLELGAAGDQSGLLGAGRYATEFSKSLQLLNAGGVR